MLRVVPLTLAQANDLVRAHHRHHKPVRGHRFSIGAAVGDSVVAAAVVGRPVAMKTPQYRVAEVTRLVTDGTKNACSLLYARSARASEAMGFVWIQTFTLASESGASLRAAGWYPIDSQGMPCGCLSGCALCLSPGKDWNVATRGGRRTDQPMVPKRRWGRRFGLNTQHAVGLCE